MISKNFIQLALIVGAFALSSIGLAQTNSETNAPPKMSTADDAAHLPSNHRSEARCIVLINKQATNIDEIRSNLSGE